MNIKLANEILYSNEATRFLGSTGKMLLNLTKATPGDLVLMMAEVHKATVASVQRAIGSRFTSENNRAAAGMLLAVASAYTLADTFSGVARAIEIRPEELPLAKELLKAMGYEGTTDVIIRDSPPVGGKN